jgi:hypothetical protein
MRALLVASLLLAACGGSSSSGAAEPASGGSSSGGEAADPTANAPPAISTGPAPLPIPTPPVARGDMSPALQAIWTRTEEILAEGPPPPPGGDQNVEDWTSRTLQVWLSARSAAIGELTEQLSGLGAAPLYERAIGAALLGTLIEDFVADVRGAPIPAAVAADPELLGIYRSSLDGMLGGIAERSAVSFQICAGNLDQLGDPAWGEWRAFCFERAEELAEIYGDRTVEDGGDD